MEFAWREIYNLHLRIAHLDTLWEQVWVDLAAYLRARRGGRGANVG